MFSGFHVNLISRSKISSSSDDQLELASNEQISELIDDNSDIWIYFVDDSERSEPLKNSMLTASDNGRAQFVRINIGTFAIRPESLPSISE